MTKTIVTTQPAANTATESRIDKVNAWMASMFAQVATMDAASRASMAQDLRAMQSEQNAGSFEHTATCAVIAMLGA